MRVRRVFTRFFIAALLAAQPGGMPSPAAAQERESNSQSREQDIWRGAAPAVTRHQITVAGKALRYTATAGHMPIKSEDGVTEAALFFTAYTLDRSGTEQRSRPLTFAFNGGPGAGTVWLHLGGLGPRRIHLEPEGFVPAPPYATLENPHSILDLTDLVFIDAPGTGFSRVRPEAIKKYYSITGDIEAFGKFIRLYLSRYDRWNSPIFLFGESYGTTRAAGLANHLIDEAIPVSGVALLSVALDLQTLTPGNLNDLPYKLIVPSYTLIAAYHKKLAPALSADIEATLKQVEAWSLSAYAAALAKGAALPPDERRKIVTQLAAYTGLSEEVIEQADLRIDAQTFRQNLLKDQRLQVGRVDGRFTGPMPQGAVRTPLYDPAMAAMFPAFSSMMSHYSETELGYKSGLAYKIFSSQEVLARWDWGNASQGYPQTATALQSAMVKNKHLKVVVLDGMYDLATPYFASAYTFNHLHLSPEYRKNLSFARFKAGHMVYNDAVALKEMKEALAAFYQQAPGGK